MAVNGDRDGARVAVDVLSTEFWWMRVPYCFLLPATTATSLFSSSFSFLFFALGGEVRVPDEGSGVGWDGMDR